MKGDIIKAYAEWYDEAQCFAVFLARENEDGHMDIAGGTPLRPLPRCIGNDAVEARLAWAVTIHCPKDADTTTARAEFFRFKRRAQAGRVAARCNKELAAIRRGEPVLEGTAAQAACILAGGKNVGMFAITHYLRGKIAGT